MQTLAVNGYSTDDICHSVCALGSCRAKTCMGCGIKDISKNLERIGGTSTKESLIFPLPFTLVNN